MTASDLVPGRRCTTPRRRARALPGDVIGQLEDEHSDPPEERQRFAEPGRARPGGQEIAPGPGEGSPRPRHGAALNLGESPEQTLVPHVAEAGEVEPVQVHLLHERRLRVDDPVRLEDPVNLLDAAPGIGHMLEDGLRHHRVDAAVLEREIMRVAEDRRRRVGRRVDVDETDGRLPGELAHPFAPDAAAHQQHHRRRASFQQQALHGSKTAHGGQIHRRRGDPAQPQPGLSPRALGVRVAALGMLRRLIAQVVAVVEDGPVLGDQDRTSGYDGIRFAAPGVATTKNAGDLGHEVALAGGAAKNGTKAVSGLEHRRLRGSLLPMVIDARGVAPRMAAGQGQMVIWNWPSTLLSAS